MREVLSRTKPRFERSLKFLTKILYDLGVTPNMLTFFGLLIGLLSAYLIATGDVYLGIALLLLSGFCDVLDGSLAKNHGMVTKFGEFLDSTLDRFVDGFVFIAVGYHYKLYFLSSIALLFSILISYSRAKAERFVRVCDVGLMERSERIILLSIALASGFVKEGLIAIIILSFITIVHRIVYTRKMVTS